MAPDGSAEIISRNLLPGTARTPSSGISASILVTIVCSRSVAVKIIWLFFASIKTQLKIGRVVLIGIILFVSFSAEKSFSFVVLNSFFKVFNLKGVSLFFLYVFMKETHTKF